MWLFVNAHYGTDNTTDIRLSADVSEVAATFNRLDTSTGTTCNHTSCVIAIICDSSFRCTRSKSGSTDRSQVANDTTNIQIAHDVACV